MSKEFKIEKEVPIAKIAGRENDWRGLASKMTPGDSVLLDGHAECGYLIKAAKRLGLKVISRADKKTGLRRCWMIGKLK